MKNNKRIEELEQGILSYCIAHDTQSEEEIHKAFQELAKLVMHLIEPEET